MLVQCVLHAVCARCSVCYMQCVLGEVCAGAVCARCSVCYMQCVLKRVYCGHLVVVTGNVGLT